MTKLRQAFWLLFMLLLTSAISAQEMQPVDGGVLRIPGSWPRHYNVFQITSGRQAAVFRLIYSGLIRIDYDLDGYVNDLAESYEVSPDGREYTFHLRDGVIWHDGTPFAADDVEFTFTQALNPATGTVWSARLASLVGAAEFTAGTTERVDGIEVIDPLTIRFRLNESSVTFLDTIALISIAPKHILEAIAPADFTASEQFLTHPVGTGAFIHVSQRENEIIEFARNPNYYLGVPHIERIIIPILDPDTALAAFERGDVELVTLRTPEAIARMSTMPGITVVETPTLFIETLFINARNPYLADPRVRQALLMAIDRETLANVVLNGTKRPLAFSTPFLHPLMGDAEGLQTWNYNPAAARQLLEDAGWDFSRVLRWTGQLAQPLPEMLAIQQMLAEIGVQTEFQLVADGAAQLEVRFVSHEWDIEYSGLQIGTDPDELSQRLECDREYPAGLSDGYCNNSLDELLDEARVTSELEMRRALYHQAQAIVNADLPFLPLYRRVQYTAVTNRFHDPSTGYGIEMGHLTVYAPVHEWWLEPAS